MWNAVLPGMEVVIISGHSQEEGSQAGDKQKPGEQRKGESILETLQAEGNTPDSNRLQGR